MIPAVFTILASLIGALGQDSTSTATCGYQTAYQGSAFPKNANQSIWTLDVTQFRKDHSTQGGYNKTWDLSDLPSYQPQSTPNGTLRIYGSNYLKDGPLGGYWADAFAKFQPGIQINYTLPTSAIAVQGLATKVADLGVGRPATLDDLLTYEQVFKYDPLEITAATGSFDVYGWSPAYVIVVPKSSPIEKISMQQLDGIFGGARGGGYNRSTWLTDYPYRRGPEENIRTFGQLGVTSPQWLNRPIHPCGQQTQANIQVVFQDLVLRGSNQWNEDLRTFANYATENQTIAQWYDQVRDYAVRDELALCVSSPQVLVANDTELKEIPVQPFNGGDYVNRTLETVRDRSYPLINSIFFYGNKAPGQSMDPMAYEFLSFVLSQEGQQEVQREGRYLPLTGSVVSDMRARLE